MTFEEFRHLRYSATQSCHGLPKAGGDRSDIVLHLPILEYLASLCEHVTEFGVRDGHSTTALLAGCRGEVHSWDIQESPFKFLAKEMVLPCRWVFHLGNTGEPQSSIGPTDFLLFDTAHTYEHVRAELSCHGRKARRFLVFHDTAETSCGVRDLSGPDPRALGIIPAVEEFLAQHLGEYRTWYRTTACNGLWVLERTS